MSAWDTEFAPANLIATADQIRRAFALPWVAIGMIGDRQHFYGYHRSRRWINELGAGSSDYSNQLALDLGGQADWVSAIDVSLDPDRMKLATARLIAALKRKDPAVAGVRECFGTVDGETVVGWDAAKGRPTTSDDSHLWHLHISLYRSQANTAQPGLVQVLTTDGGDDMALELTTVVPRASEPNFNRTVEMILADVWRAVHGVSQDSNAVVHAVQASVDSGIPAIREDISHVVAGNVDISALVAGLTPVIREIVADELSKLVLKAD